MEVPMLNEKEYLNAHKLYGLAFKGLDSGKSREERFKPLLDYYNELTNFGETEPNAIMHHRIIDFGSPCEKCGKPYRTSKASYCASCGNKKPIPTTRKLIDKKPASIARRYYTSIRSQGYMPIIFYGFLVLCHYLLILKFPNDPYNMFIYMAPIYIYLFIIRPVIESRYYISKIEISEEHFVLNYLDYNKVRTATIPLQDIRFLLRNRVKNSFSDRIKFFNKTEKILTQYCVGDWSFNETKKLGSLLIKEGIKKPLGENL